MEDPWKMLGKRKKIDEEIKILFEKRYGGRGRRAVDAVKERRIKRYNDFYIVIGTEEHIVVEDYCNCMDFLFKTSREDKDCWHILAVKIADMIGEYDRIDLWYHEISPIL
jgi:Uncharacterized metal-binding protein